MSQNFFKTLGRSSEFFFILLLVDVIGSVIFLQANGATTTLLGAKLVVSWTKTGSDFTLELTFLTLLAYLLFVLLWFAITTQFKKHASAK